MIFFSTKIKICSNSTFINKKKYNFGLYELLNKPVVQEKMDRLINDRTKFSIIIEEQNISQETINKIKTVFTNHLTRCELIKDSHNQYYFKKKLLSLSIPCQILIVCACLMFTSLISITSNHIKSHEKEIVKYTKILTRSQIYFKKKLAKKISNQEILYKTFINLPMIIESLSIKHNKEKKNHKINIIGYIDTRKKKI